MIKSLDGVNLPGVVQADKSDKASNIKLQCIKLFIVFMVGFSPLSRSRERVGVRVVQIQKMRINLML